MTNETKQKILDAALKLFAEKGYNSATIRDITTEAGVNDSTLFRKFKTKENLFSSVLIQNYQKMKEDFDSIIVHNEFEDQADFLETFIRNLMNLGKNNFDFIKLTVDESNRIPINFLEDFINNLSEYLEKNIQSKEINYKIFVFNALSFIYFLLLDYGHVFKDHDKAIEKFINNSTLCIK